MIIWWLIGAGITIGYANQKLSEMEEESFFVYSYIALLYLVIWPYVVGSEIYALLGDECEFEDNEQDE
jgi:hypothetical protein